MKILSQTLRFHLHAQGKNSGIWKIQYKERSNEPAQKNRQCHIWMTWTGDGMQCTFTQKHQYSFPDLFQVSFLSKHHWFFYEPIYVIFFFFCLNFRASTDHRTQAFVCWLEAPKSTLHIQKRHKWHMPKHWHAKSWNTSELVTPCGEKWHHRTSKIKRELKKQQ